MICENSTLHFRHHIVAYHFSDPGRYWAGTVHMHTQSSTVLLGVDCMLDSSQKCLSRSSLVYRQTTLPQADRYVPIRSLALAEQLLATCHTDLLNPRECHQGARELWSSKADVSGLSARAASSIVASYSNCDQRIVSAVITCAASGYVVQPRRHSRSLGPHLLSASSQLAVWVASARLDR